MCIRPYLIHHLCTIKWSICRKQKTSICSDVDIKQIISINNLSVCVCVCVYCVFDRKGIYQHLQIKWYNSCTEIVYFNIFSSTSIKWVLLCSCKNKETVALETYLAVDQQTVEQRCKFRLIIFQSPYHSQYLLA